MSSSQYVGFANLPNQVHRKFIKKGFEFTLMMVGESGMGKSTLISSLGLPNWQNTPVFTPFCYGLHDKSGRNRTDRIYTFFHRSSFPITPLHLQPYGAAVIFNCHFVLSEFDWSYERFPRQKQTFFYFSFLSHFFHVVSIPFSTRPTSWIAV